MVSLTYCSIAAFEHFSDQTHIYFLAKGLEETGSIFVSKEVQQAKPTVMGGQQVCNQACRPCNDGGVTVTTQ